jgi:Fe-S cluster biogenesis protein NfuA
MFRSTSIARSRASVASLTQRLVAGTYASTSSTRSVHHLAAAAAASTNPHPNHLLRHDQWTNPHQQQIRTVFIQTENTPNPESLKFLPSGMPVLENEDGTGYFVNKTDPKDDILRSPLCKELFEIDGVKSVYLGSDFVSITKYAEAKWQFMRPDIFACLMEFFDSNQPVLLDQPLITDTTILDDDDEIVAMIKELIEQRIRPAVQEDGGDIRYVSFEEDTGLVTVQLAGSCVGCPSSSITLKQGVENMLMHYLPEVTAVVSKEEDPEEGAATEEEEPIKTKTYEERLASAGIPFSD